MQIRADNICKSETKTRNENTKSTKNGKAKKTKQAKIFCRGYPQMCGTVSRKLKRQSHPKIAGAHTVTPSHRFHAIRAAYAICLNSSGRNANPNTRSAARIMHPSLLNSPRVSPLILPLIADMLSLFILFFLFIISIRSMLFILIAHIYICSS